MTIGSLCRMGRPGRALAAGLVLLALTIPRAHAAWARANGLDRYSSIVVDARTGAVLEDFEADAPRHPASLTKMMTLYMLFEALRDRRVSLDELVPVSAHAASMEPTKLGLVPGTQITVQQAILGLVTLSANDAAAALGELLGGSEGRFAQMMTLRARALGMARTTFRNASGLPDEAQWTTAHDLALLARHLIQDFPDQYHYFSTPSFVFHGRAIYNHDSMLRSYPGADGIKTGFINEAGHNLVTSAVHGGVRLIGVVLGANTNAQRDIHMTALLNEGFQAEGVAPEVAMARAEPRLPALMTAAQAAEPVPRLRPAMHRVPIRLPAARHHEFAHRTAADSHWQRTVSRLRVKEHTPLRVAHHARPRETDHARQTHVLALRRERGHALPTACGRHHRACQGPEHPRVASR